MDNTPLQPNTNADGSRPAHTPYPHTLTFETFVKRHVPALREAAENGTGGPPLPFPPKARFMGTLKLHGYNATIIFRHNDLHNPTFQSRNRVVTYQDRGPIVAQLSNRPLHVLVERILHIFHQHHHHHHQYHHHHHHESEPEPEPEPESEPEKHTPPFSEIMIAGEIAGRGIYRNVAINRLPRFFCIFNIRVDGVWVDMRDYASVSLPAEHIYNIMNWPTWEVVIDFLRDDATAAASTWLQTLTEEVERECPFAASFLDSRGNKISGTGEGLVWTLIPFAGEPWPPRRTQLCHFKTKGARFEVVSRIKPTPPDNADAVQLARVFVDYAIAEARFEQGIEYLKEMGLLQLGPKAKSCTPHFVKWVETDVIEEEWEKMVEMGAEEQKVRNVIGVRAREWLFAYLEEAQRNGDSGSPACE